MRFVSKVDSCPSRKLIRHTIKPPTVLNDDAGRRLLVIVLPFHVLAVAQIAIQDYPFPVTDTFHGPAAARRVVEGRAGIHNVRWRTDSSRTGRIRLSQ